MITDEQIEKLAAPASPAYREQLTKYLERMRGLDDLQQLADLADAFLSGIQAKK